MVGRARHFGHRARAYGAVDAGSDITASSLWCIRTRIDEPSCRDEATLDYCASRRCSILLTFEKLTHNATKPNNAWWRWIRSEQRNPPVTTKTADTHCARLFKIAHFQARPLLFSN